MHIAAKAKVDAHKRQRQAEVGRNSQRRGSIPYEQAHHIGRDGLFRGIRGRRGSRHDNGRTLDPVQPFNRDGCSGGFVAPDETTFEYIKGREYAPKGADWDKAVAYWKTLKSGDDAVFDKELVFDADDIEPRITYGTNPGMGIGINGSIPALDEIPEAERAGFEKSLKYMGFKPGEKLLGHPIDYVFLGACTNGRIEDFRAFAEIVKGKHKAENVVAWLVPGSHLVAKQIKEEGLDKILTEAGFAIRQPGCSACLAMNDDKVPAGKYSVSTSNRNFEGRQGPGSRTILASPLVAAAAALTGKITDPRTL